MEESTMLTNARSRVSRKHNRRSEFIDECSTDSGCSNSRSIGSGERICGGGRSPRRHNYLELRGHFATSYSQERLPRSFRSCNRDRHSSKSSRSWSPSDGRDSTDYDQSSPHSSSSSDDRRSDSDSTTKQSSTIDTLRRAFRTLKISWRDTEKKKHAKKSRKSILRSPVSYTYVRGLSGLPTHRVPRNSTPKTILPCVCQKIIRLNR
ncbi:uncharacterized protein LOC107217805 [Neodiprion lecontei]|uniref:Uncharacterized protein LOC107217805 n=1 Tax=Neodiprion lecontei TaxID=441921 RepID=A0ABM3FD94_NEOLC|nr:uncharacterized protein LOC107217805 [Neodiprion lecontei]